MTCAKAWYLAQTTCPINERSHHCSGWLWCYYQHISKPAYECISHHVSAIILRGKLLLLKYYSQLKKPVQNDHMTCPRLHSPGVEETEIEKQVFKPSTVSKFMLPVIVATSLPSGFSTLGLSPFSDGELSTHRGSPDNLCPKSSVCSMYTYRSIDLESASVYHPPIAITAPQELPGTNPLSLSQNSPWILKKPSPATTTEFSSLQAQHPQAL